MSLHDHQKPIPNEVPLELSWDGLAVTSPCLCASVVKIFLANQG